MRLAWLWTWMYKCQDPRHTTAHWLLLMHYNDNKTEPNGLINQATVSSPPMFDYSLFLHWKLVWLGLRVPYYLHYHLSSRRSNHFMSNHPLFFFFFLVVWSSSTMVFYDPWIYNYYYYHFKLTVCSLLGPQKYYMRIHMWVGRYHCLSL